MKPNIHVEKWFTFIGTHRIIWHFKTYSSEGHDFRTLDVKIRLCSSVPRAWNDGSIKHFFWFVFILLFCGHLKKRVTFDTMLFFVFQCSFPHSFYTFFSNTGFGHVVLHRQSARKPLEWFTTRWANLRPENPAAVVSWLLFVCKSKWNAVLTLRKTNELHLKIGRNNKNKERIVSQPSIFRGELLVSGRAKQYEYLSLEICFFV